MKKLAYVSGSRAEYGIMKRLLGKMRDSSEIDLRIIVTGMHLDEKYGNTYKIIEKDGFRIEKKVDINTEGNSNYDVIKSMSICMEKFNEIFRENEYDAVMILGDRYEMLPVATVAAMNNMPIIHIHGGEKTLGNYDEFIRHSITKMSRFHIASTEEYKNRIIQLGENPETVKNLGSLGAENASLIKEMDKEELGNIVGGLDKEYFVVLFHPETITNVSVKDQTVELLKGLESFREKYEFIFIGSNSDTGSEQIREIIEKFCKENGCRRFASLKVEEYQSLVKNSMGLVGNSSSGIIEVPTLRVPTVNIGDRQKGRVRGETVIDCKCERGEIEKAIRLALSEEFRKKVKKSKNPYLQENTLELYYDEILKFLNKFDGNKVKDFYDLNLEKSGEGGMKIRVVFASLVEKIKKKFFNKNPLLKVCIIESYLPLLIYSLQEKGNFNDTIFITSDKGLKRILRAHKVIFLNKDERRRKFRKNLRKKKKKFAEVISEKEVKFFGSNHIKSYRYFRNFVKEIEVFDDGLSLYTKGLYPYKCLFSNKVKKIKYTGIAEIPEDFLEKVELIDLNRQFQLLAGEEQDRILKLFDVTAEDVEVLRKSEIIVFTQPFSEDGLMTEKEQIKLYADLLKEYKKEKILIKTHPRENKDYKKLLGDDYNINVFEKKIPSEIFNMLGIRFKLCMTIFSTASLTINADKIVFTGTEVHENLLKVFGVIEKKETIS